MKKVTLSRIQLYDMVWKEPLTVISGKFHLTYSELRKIYHDMEIPIPEGGYWSRLRWGKTPIITELPEEYSGKDEIELYEKESGDPVISCNNSKETNDSNSESIFRVPGRLTNPDPYVATAKEYFEANRKGYYGSNRRILDGTRILSIDVENENLPRALRIFDTIIKVLRARGHEISFDWSGTVAVIYDQKVTMRLREVHRVSDKPRDRFSTRELEPTGKFTFMVGRYNEKAVTDGQKRIEDKIDTIINKLEAEARYWYDWQIKNEIREREQKEQERIEREAKDRKNKELSDFKSLYVLASRLHQSNIMRNYISLVEENTQKSGNDTSEHKQWIIWAREKVDWYDPLRNRIDPILDDNDKVEILIKFLENELDNKG